MDSLVVYADMLGFTQRVQDAFQTNTASTLLTSLRQTFDLAVKYLRGGGHRQPRWTVKFFTDNIVIGYPSSYIGAGRSELSSLLEHLGLFQFALACKGFFVRGAISAGEHYMDSDIVFGDALLIPEIT
jgi:hypothetical protein